MAEETLKITTVEKVKDPRRVEQGKRLAAIPREAKERKAKEREQRKVSESSEFLWVIPVIVIVALDGGYYFFTKGEESQKAVPKEVEVPEPEKEKKVEVPRSSSKLFPL